MFVEWNGLPADVYCERQKIHVPGCHHFRQRTRVVNRAI